LQLETFSQLVFGKHGIANNIDLANLGAIAFDNIETNPNSVVRCAQKNWRRQRGFNYLAKVITGVKFKNGIEVAESNQVAA
jgi:hypothetical protein